VRQYVVAATVVSAHGEESGEYNRKVDAQRILLGADLYSHRFDDSQCRGALHTRTRRRLHSVPKFVAILMEIDSYGRRHSVRAQHVGGCCNGGGLVV